MSKLKKGDLVKCWDSGWEPSRYEIGRFYQEVDGVIYAIPQCDFYMIETYDHAVRVPDELAKQLEGLE